MRETYMRIHRMCIDPTFLRGRLYVHAMAYVPAPTSRDIETRYCSCMMGFDVEIVCSSNVSWGG